MNVLTQLSRFGFGGHVEGLEDIDRCPKQKYSPGQAATPVVASAGRGHHA